MIGLLTKVVDGSAAGIVSWLLTYIMHSTLLLGGVWLLLRWRPVRPAWEETLWKLALFGSMATALAHAVADCDPLVDSWDVTRFHPDAARLGTSPFATRADAVVHHWLLALAFVWAVGAAIRLIELGRRHRRLLRALAGRRPAGGEAYEALREVAGHLAAEIRLRVTALEGLPTPLALGRGEVIVPRRLAQRLDEGPLRCILAHEVGHLVRRDPLWSLAAGLVEAVAFFQPLNRVARRRLASLAEIQADRWAVWRTGSPLALARGLEGVARALVEPRPDLAGLAASGEGRSGLASRVRHILEFGSEEERTPTRRRKALVVGAVVLLCIYALPSFSWIHDADDYARWNRSPRASSGAVVAHLARPPARRGPGS